MNKKKTYYRIKSPSQNTVDGKIKRTMRDMYVEVVVTEHKAGMCMVTPVTGYGSMRVKAEKLVLM